MEPILHSVTGNQENQDRAALEADRCIGREVKGVGGRHGKPVLLTIRAGEMHRAGFIFCCSANGVWLVDHVPPQYINFPH